VGKGWVYRPLLDGSQTIKEPGLTPTNPTQFLKTSQLNHSLRTYPEFTILVPCEVLSYKPISILLQIFKNLELVKVITKSKNHHPTLVHPYFLFVPGYTSFGFTQV
jgi:hypothetical protein